MPWKLVFENDAKGKPIQGDVTDLIKAVGTGADVRVLLEDGTAFTADFVQVKGGVVSAYKNPHGASVKDKSTASLRGTKWFVKS